MAGRTRKLKKVNTAAIFILAVCMCFCAASCGLRRESADLSKNSDYAVLDEVPEWNGEPYIEVNGNVPELSKSEIRKAEKAAGKDSRFIRFTELDRLGRCGSVFAVIGPETMPEGNRGSIGMIKPSGWQISKYDFIDNGGYLYNRCHLVGWQLSGENDEERNLITGTRYMNTSGMLPFENEVAEYVRSTGNHVIYRATPIFRDDELLARGVTLEAYSLEDKGKGVTFNVFCYNVEPGVKISYNTGKNTLDESTLPEEAKNTEDGVDKAKKEAKDAGSDKDTGDKDISDKDSGEKDSGSEDRGDANSDSEGTNHVKPLDVPEGVTFVLNNNTMRFHRTDCKGAATILEHNRSWFYGTREEAIDKGYVPCGMCKP